MTGSGAPGSQRVEKPAESSGEKFRNVFSEAREPVKEAREEAQPQDASAVPPLFRVLPKAPDVDAKSAGVEGETQELSKPGLFDPDLILGFDFSAAGQGDAKMPEKGESAPEISLDIPPAEAALPDEGQSTAPLPKVSEVPVESAPLLPEGDTAIAEKPLPGDVADELPEANPEERIAFGKEAVVANDANPESAAASLPLSGEVALPQNFRRSLAERKNTLKTGVNVAEDRPTIDTGVSPSAEAPIQNERSARENLPAADPSVEVNPEGGTGNIPKGELAEEKTSPVKDAAESGKKAPATSKGSAELPPAPERPTRTFNVADILANLRGAMRDSAPESLRAEAASIMNSAVADLPPDSALGRGVQAVLEFLKNEGVTQARVVVDPPALGRIDVSLQIAANGIEATFRVDNEQLRQVLQNQLDQLKQSLLDQGIHVSGLTVDIRSGDDRDQRGAAAAKKLRRSGGVEAADDETTEDPSMLRLDLEKGLLHWVG